MRILLTNNTLASLAGSEVYIRDLALSLMRRGHNPVVYSTVLGTVAEDLRRATIPVTDCLENLSVAPDLIHGQHHLETMTAALTFPQVPVVSVCHGWLPWEEMVPIFPSICHYVAIDDLCRERLLARGGIPEDKISVCYNAVDLDRFLLRPPLPEKPQKALVFSNYADERIVNLITRVCRRAGIDRVDFAGERMGRVLSAPEEVLGTYDLVFAKARCAIEALATGCAVVVTDYAGLAGMVTSANLKELRRLNFGVRSLQSQSLREETLFEEVLRYDSADARRVSLRLREDASFTVAVDWWERLYRQVQENWQSAKAGLNVDAVAQSRAAAAYLQELSPAFKERYEASRQADLAARRTALAASQADVAEERCRVVEAKLLEAENQALQASTELANLRDSRAWRLLTRYRAIKYGALAQIGRLLR